MKSFKKKFLSLILVMAMLITVIPTDVFATFVNNNSTVVTEESTPENNTDDKNQENDEEENQKVETTNPNNTTDKENQKEDEQKLEEPDKKDDKIDWPEKPDWIGMTPQAMGVPYLESGQNSSAFYAIPLDKLTQEDIDKARKESENAEVEQKKEISASDFNLKVAVFINGKEYTGGDVAVKEGEHFSYRLDWGPINEKAPVINNGDYFTKKLFTVKGLKFNNIEKKLVIDGINVGNMNLNYNPNTGEMVYTVTFTKYINLFNRNSVFAYYQGSSSFSHIEDDDLIIDVNGNGGKLEIGKIERPTIPNTPSGNGWDAPKPPIYGNSLIPFAKGVKWDNHDNQNAKDPQIEWRVNFLEKLQKKQREFLKTHPIETKEGILGKIDKIIEDVKFMADSTISSIKTNKSSNEKRSISEKGYCIVEDTLDENQVFCTDEKVNDEDKNRYGKAPFFIELPVILIGTDYVMSGKPGDMGANGPGDMKSYVSGKKFKEIMGDDNSQKRAMVESQPMTYAILKDKKNRKETLIINCGKLGETGEGNLNWPENSIWPEKKLKEHIKNAQNKIDQIVSGQISPISNLKTKYTELENVLRKIDALPDGVISPEERESIKDFRDDYKSKVIDSALSNDAQITEENIPSLEKLSALDSIKISGDGQTTLKNSQQYANYKKSLSNVINDQKIFLENRAKYTAEWEILKSRYERTLEFYTENKGIDGFVLKIRSNVIKNSTSGFSNDVTISDGEREYSAHKDHNVKFNGGIVGNFSLGSVVLKKSDSNWPESDTLEQLNKANGLSGAVFNIYCAEKRDGKDVFVKDDKNKAHFLGKDASENGDAYTYTHTGNQQSGPINGEEKDLVVNKDGTLVLNRLDTVHSHYAVEIKAPEGYYIDERPIEIRAKENEVTYKLVPNVQRSIGIRKVDAYSKKAIGGAEFELYKGKEKITNFKKKTVNGHTGYYIDKEGKDKLITSDDILSNNKDDESPNLCIHGLDAGTYTLKEVKSPEGYEKDVEGKEFTFTLPEKFNETVGSTKFDELDHMVKDDKGNDAIIENNPIVDKLSFTKIDGNEPEENKSSKEDNIVQKVADKLKDVTSPDYGKYDKLEGAYFSLFRFKGSETDWKDVNLRENTANWEIIKPSKNSKYFTTDQTVEDVKSDRPEDIFNKSVPAIKTGKNGKIDIKNIPKGHYTLAEVKAPEGYSNSFRKFYMQSSDTHILSKGLKLYRDVAEDGRLVDPLTANAILNFRRKLKLKLVKYDADGTKPIIAEENKLPEKYGNPAYRYDSDIKNPNGIKGVTYKLFLQSEGSRTNPDPEEIKPENKDSIVGKDKKYDICKAVGVTDENGVLDITKMKDVNKEESFKDGLHMGQYYLIEVATSKEYGEGFILDQTPIKFNLDKDLFKEFPNQENTGIGIVKIAANSRGESGIKVIKNNEDKKALKNAEFIVKDSDGNYLSIDRIEGKESQYRLSDSSKNPQNSVKISTDFDTPSKDNPSIVENYGKIPDEYKIRTGENGYFILRGLTAGREYQFVEIKAPIGYKIPDNNTFKAKAPKTREDEGAQKLEEDNLIYLTKEIENTKLKGSVRVSKIDSNTRKGLKGAKFALYKKISPKDSSEKEIEAEYKLVKENLMTDDEGILSISDLDWGEYYIQEKEAPEGYVLDESRYHFIINERSFDENGNNVEIEIPYIENSPKGARRIKINKTDETNKPIEGVKFVLEKRHETEDGELEWIPYGKEFYETNEKGVIEMVLPVGSYKLVEVETSGGHILDDNELYFEVKSTDKVEHEIKVLNIVNIKAETAFYLKKTLGRNGENTNIPLKDVEFNFYDNRAGNNTLKFREIRSGLYRYSENQNEEGLVNNLKTDENGEIRIALNKDFVGQNPKKELYYQEKSAPGNIVIDHKIYKANMFEENYWTSAEITNQITPDNKKVKIEVDKRNENGNPLPGAEFTIFDRKGKKLASKTTKLVDMSAIAEFTDDDIAGGFKLNEKYYIKETKAPKGFVEDESILEFIVDSESFVQDENGNWTMPPISFIAINSKVKGSLKLVKVDSKNEQIPLKNAEFELFKKRECPVNGEIGDENPDEEMNQNNSDTQNDSDNENTENILTKIINKFKDIINLEDEENEDESSDSTPETKPEEWAHYGETTYKTDENGEINLVLPSGEYYYIERKAPFGYETSSLKKGGFTIAKNQENGENQQIEEKVVKVTNEKIPGKLGKVTLIKYNSSMEKTLAGAGFKLFCKDNSDGKFKMVDNTLYTTDTNGKLTINNLPPGEYYLLETVAPDGYQLPTDFESRKHYFNIERDSKLTQNVLLNVTNNKKGEEFKKGSMILEKIDKENKNKLQGAEFKLYYETKTTDGGKEFVPYEEKTFVTEEDGRIVFDNLPIGKYYIEEIKAPEGYKLPEKDDDRKHYFEISGNDKELLNIILTVENSKNGTGGGIITPNPEKPNPEKPEQPEPGKPNPEKPEQPDSEKPNPEKPEQPEPGKPNPEKPEQPDSEKPNPEKPEQPDSEKPNPEKPEKPSQNEPGREEPNKNEGSSIISKLPKTGDAASLGLASVAFVGAGTGLYAIRKKNHIPMKRNSRRRRNMKKNRKRK